MHLGVVVGKFQTPWLVPDHMATLRTAATNTDEVAVFLLDMEVEFSTKNPFTYAYREKLLANYLTDSLKKKCTIYKIRDEKYFSRLQENIDATLIKKYPADTKMTMFGNGFVKDYDGICDVMILETNLGRTAAEARLDAMTLPYTPSENHGKGQAYAAYNRTRSCRNYVVVIMVVDLDGKKFLAINDKRYKKLTFPITQVNGDEDHLQAYASKLVKHEVPLATNVKFTAFKSFIQHYDWRFRASTDICVYHTYICEIGNKPPIGKGLEILEELREKDFEEEFKSTVNSINAL